MSQLQTHDISGDGYDRRYLKSVFRLMTVTFLVCAAYLWLADTVPPEIVGAADTNECIIVEAWELHLETFVLNVDAGEKVLLQCMQLSEVDGIEIPANAYSMAMGPYSAVVINPGECRVARCL